MSRMRGFANRVAAVVDRIDRRVDKPAKDRGVHTQGSEQMIDSDMAREAGRSTSNRRSGFGRGL